MYFPIIDVLKENFIAKIPSIVTQWLTDNVDPVGSAVVVDTSLSISGAAADAKITGDELNDLKSDLNKVATIDEILTVNVFNKATATQGGYLNNSGNVNDSSDTAYGYSDYIKVNSGDVVRFYRRSQLDAFPGCLYYADGTVANIKNAPDYTQASANGEPSSFTVPSGVNRIRINIRWGYLDEYMVTINNTYPSSYVAFKIQTKINEGVVIPLESVLGLSPLYGKNIMFCGDSITYGAHADVDANGNKKNFGYYIEQQTGCNSLYNAISGSTMMNVTGKSPFCVNRYQQLGADLDYIVLAFSTNDSAESVDLIGDSSSTDDTTFWGAWKKVLNYLIEHYPTAKIGIIAFWRGNQKYLYTDALREISHNFMVPMLDFMFDENVPLVGGTDFRTYNPNAPFTVDYNTLVARQETFLYDTVHPNDEGYRYLSTIIRTYLEKL